MPVFKRGQELGRGDLSLNLKTRDGNPSNAAEIHFNIYDFTTGTEVLLPPTNRAAENPSIGEYFAPFFVPLDANIGKYRVRWDFRQFVGSQQVQVLQEFDIVETSTQVITLPGVTNVEFDLIRSLRILLRDNNPDRNYHFVPPAHENTINQFTRVFGYIWEDEEMLEYLRIALDVLNSYPPMTFYQTLDNLIGQNRPWRHLLLEAAMIYATTALSLNWVVDEFGYSISGVSLDIDKSSKYQSLASDLRSRLSEDITAAKETVKVIMGLRQSRFGVGIRSSFGPNVGRGSLTPRRFLGI